MTIKKNDWVQIEYTGKFEDGEIFDSNEGKEPLTFQVGSGMLIKGFDKAVVGMKEGEEKETKVKPEEGYGLKNKDVVELPIEVFNNPEMLEKGKEMEIMTPQGPFVINVIEKVKDKVKATLNHPLAGETLKFKIKIKKVLDEKEVEKIEKEMQEQANSGCSCGQEDDCSGCK
jgi:peptidylprolyl isomerase